MKITNLVPEDKPWVKTNVLCIWQIGNAEEICSDFIVYHRMKLVGESERESLDLRLIFPPRKITTSYSLGTEAIWF